MSCSMSAAASPGDEKASQRCRGACGVCCCRLVGRPTALQIFSTQCAAAVSVHPVEDLPDPALSRHIGRRHDVVRSASKQH